jgi:YggT family protein
MQYLITFLGLLLQILWIAILIRVILSWFPVDPSNPIIRRIIPRIGMFDLSPLAAWLVISFVAAGIGVRVGF